MTQRLPTYRSVLTVCSHPDDESFGLGAVLDAFSNTGSRLGTLCFTHGETTTLGATRDTNLGAVRAGELDAACEILGVREVELLDYPDGALATIPVAKLADHVSATAVRVGADLLLVFDADGITGHPDHRAATAAALVAAEDLDLPVLAWTIPSQVATALSDEFGTAFIGRDDSDLTIAVDRTRQHDAIRQHHSQSQDNPVLWQRLELLGNTEHLRFLRHTTVPPAPDQARPRPSPPSHPARIDP
jgi:N-acetylglucosamine malate deacetylase 2